MDLVTLIEEVVGWQPTSTSSTWTWYTCPFHEDNHPSFGVQADHWYCFQCHRHGSLVGFLMQIAHWPRDRAIRFVYGDTPEPAWIAVDRVIREHRKRQRQVVLPPSFEDQVYLGDFVDRAVVSLWQSSCKGRYDLIRRQIAPSVARSAQIGWATQRSRGLVVPNVVDDILWSCKVRTNRPGLKYYLMPGSVLQLYRLSEERRSDLLIVCEAELDALTARTACPDAAVWAMGGTGGLGLLLQDTWRIRAYPRRILCLDSDQGGREAAAKVLAAVSMENRVPPDGMDLGDLAEAGWDIRSFLRGEVQL